MAAPIRCFGDDGSPWAWLWALQLAEPLVVTVVRLELDNLASEIQGLIAHEHFAEAKEACRKGLRAALEDGDEQGILAFAESYVATFEFETETRLGKAGLVKCVSCGRESTDKKLFVAFMGGVACVTCVKKAYALSKRLSTSSS